MRHARLGIFLLALGLAGTLSQALAQKSDHEISGPTLTLAGEIVSLRCYLLDPVKGHGPDHSKCAEASIRRGEAAGFLSDGNLYILLGVSDPKIRPVLLASVREEVVLRGIVSSQGPFPGFSVTGIESKGIAVKPAAKPKENSGKIGLEKE